MKKKILILSMLLIGLSFKSFASTGNANDGLEFLLVILAVLLITIGLIYGIAYLQKNGKLLIYNFISFIKKMISLLRVYFNRVRSD
jgi:uncharacterized protein (UPF0333 family)